jgi:hypothetical protein
LDDVWIEVQGPARLRAVGVRGSRQLGSSSEELRDHLEVATLLDGQDVCARRQLHALQHLAVDRRIHGHAVDPAVRLFDNLHDSFDVSSAEVPDIQKGATQAVVVERAQHVDIESHERALADG